MRWPSAARRSFWTARLGCSRREGAQGKDEVISKRRSSPRIRAACAAAVAAALACAPRRPPPDLSLDPAALLEQVKRSQARVDSVRGEAAVRVEASGKSGTVPAFVAAKRPDLVHLETLDFFGNPVAVLVTAGGRMSFYDAREKVLYRGPATRENVARLVPLPMTPPELVEVLCGSAPLLPGSAKRADPGRGFVTLVIEEGELTQTLRVARGAQVERSELRGPGGRPPGTYDVAFGRFSERGGMRFPGETSLTATGARVRLRWKEIDPNAVVDAALFRLDPPRGARVVDVGSEQPPPIVPEAGK